VLDQYLIGYNLLAFSNKLRVAALGLWEFFGFFILFASFTNERNCYLCS